MKRRKGEEPKTHDLTAKCWGRDYTFTPIEGGLFGRMTGWCGDLRDGDYLILRNGSETTRYEIEYVDYLRDPPDMWRATVKFAPTGRHKGALGEPRKADGEIDYRAQGHR